MKSICECLHNLSKQDFRIKVLFTFPLILFILLWYTQFAYGADEKPQSTAPASETADEAKNEDTYVYNPIGKIDPFKSLILGKKEKIKLEEERKKIEEAREEEKLRKELAKIPFTPLQQFELASIKVVAIIWGEVGRHALVEAPDGKGYTIEKGTYIGKSRGIVKNITTDAIIVEEKYKDVDKKIKTRSVELKLKREE